MAKDIQQSGSAHNSLTAETIIKGDITATQDIRIDGRIEGNVECAGKVVIGPTGSVMGNIVCQCGKIMGKVTGNLTVEENLTLTATCVLEGEVVTRTLVIEPNAVFHGSCRMTQNC